MTDRQAPPGIYGPGQGEEGRAPLRWTLEPHGGFRSGIAGEDWPFGYISTAEPIPSPIFALHEVIGDLSVEVLAAAARLAVAAPDLLASLRIITGLYEELQGHETAFSRDARAAIARAEGRSHA